MTVPSPDAAADERWRSPLSDRHFDRFPVLFAAEQRAIRELRLRDLRRQRYFNAEAPQWTVIRRLLAPLEEVGRSLDVPPDSGHLSRAMADAEAVLLLRCAHTGRSYWDWSGDEWLALLGENHAAFRRAVPSWAADFAVRPFLCAHAYHLGRFGDFHRLGHFDRLTLAGRVFGKALVTSEIDRVRHVLTRWGYQYGQSHDTTIPAVMSQLFLLNRSPYLEHLDTALFTRAREESLNTKHGRRGLYPLQRAVASLGYCEPPSIGNQPGLAGATGVPELWAQWVQRWFDTSTLTRSARMGHRTNLHKAGRWLAAEHPDRVDPATWTREMCAAWVAAVDRMRVGDYVARAVGDQAGKPLAAQTKEAHIGMLRAFFQDCQEWEWLPRRFSVQRALATPRSIGVLIGPSPRVIADDVWAKLLGAGLNLEADDLSSTSSAHTTFYPLELVKAITLTWLFSGLRSDEIARLRVGCIRWQHDGAGIGGDSHQVLARDAVCLLDVPAHKTGTAFTKPVDPILGQAIEAWQAVRPEQPRRTDHRTGEQVQYLFSTRARRVPSTYINKSVIPMLCRKAGVPSADVRGKITSHRARSTIASQLYNAKEPMTLFELQAWLGHRTPASTQFYAKIHPNTLTRAYNDAGYFARNVRTIEVLVDRDAVNSGAAAAGEPWQYYDLGHGFCTYAFFEQCPAPHGLRSL